MRFSQLSQKLEGYGIRFQHLCWGSTRFYHKNFPSILDAPSNKETKEEKGVRGEGEACQDPKSNFSAPPWLLIGLAELARSSIRSHSVSNIGQARNSQLPNSGMSEQDGYVLRSWWEWGITRMSTKSLNPFNFFPPDLLAFADYDAHSPPYNIYEEVWGIIQAITI